MTWSDKRSAIVRAIHERRLEDAEKLFDELRAMTRETSDPRYEADQLFTEGLLRDAQRRYEDAKRAFSAALALDRRLKGERHPAVGEALHSLAIVKSHLDDRAGAVDDYRAALEIFRETRPGHVPRVLAAIGDELLVLGRHDEALEAFETSERAAREDEKIPRQDLARAILGAGEALRRTKRWVPAFSKFAACTQLSTSAMWPRLAQEIGAAWLGLGIVSRYAIRDAQAQAAFAFWFASLLGTGEAEKKALAQLETMPERELASGDPSQLRVVYRDAAGNVHVASCADGLRPMRTSEDFDIGDAVELVDGALVRAEDPAEDPLVVLVGTAERAETVDECRAVLATLDEAWNASHHASTLLAVGEISTGVRDIARAALACARSAEDARPSRDPDVRAGLDVLEGWIEGRHTDAERAAARAKLDRYNGARDVPLAAWAAYCALGVGASPNASAWYHAAGAATATGRVLRDRVHVAAGVRRHLRCPTIDELAHAIVDDSFTLP